MSNIYNLSKSKIIKIKKGNIRKLISKKDNFFNGFEEAYISNIKFQEIKAWKIHKKIDCNLFILEGRIKFVIANFDKKLTFKEFILNPKGNNHLFIRHGTIFGFQGVGEHNNSILNISNFLHTENEVIRFKEDEFYYKRWI